jgi:hypothetical protein
MIVYMTECLEAKNFRLSTTINNVTVQEYLDQKVESLSIDLSSAASARTKQNERQPEG